MSQGDKYAHVRYPPVKETGVAMKREVATHPDALPRKGNVGNSRGASLMTTLDEGGKKMAKQKIRIRLKAYEHRTLDTAAAKNRRISYSYRCTSCGSNPTSNVNVASTQSFVRLTK